MGGLRLNPTITKIQRKLPPYCHPPLLSRPAPKPVSMNYAILVINPSSSSFAIFVATGRLDVAVDPPSVGTWSNLFNKYKCELGFVGVLTSDYYMTIIEDARNRVTTMIAV